MQPVDDNGTVTFTSIFPACYSGRWPHVHFEVYPSVAAATSDRQAGTSQIALPQDVCESVYATSGYEQSVSNLSRVSLDSDMVFSDGVVTPDAVDDRQRVEWLRVVAGGRSVRSGLIPQRRRAPA